MKLLAIALLSALSVSLVTAQGDAPRLPIHAGPAKPMSRAQKLSVIKRAGVQGKSFVGMATLTGLQPYDKTNNIYLELVGIYEGGMGQMIIGTGKDSTSVRALSFSVDKSKPYLVTYYVYAEGAKTHFQWEAGSNTGTFDQNVKGDFVIPTVYLPGQYFNPALFFPPNTNQMVYVTKVTIEAIKG